jgi:N4-gp56 family major capsid protein
MTIQTYNSASPRIGKLKGAILAHAVPQEVLGITGEYHKMPKNGSDTIIFRRWLPVGASTGTAASINRWSVDPATHLTQEGVTGQAETVAPQDIPVILQQYSCLYSYTDKTADLYEDDVPAIMKKQTGERMGLVREMIRYGTLKGCTNRFYAGGLSRGAVNTTISLGMLRKISRSIKGNRGKHITSVLGASAQFNTAPVEASFLVFVHTDADNDIRNLPGFVKCAEYGSRKMVHENELGSVDNFRFITSPELNPYLGLGASVSGTGMVSVGAANVDVYPFIVVGEDAWGDVVLRGKESFDVTHLPANQKTKEDPHGQRGYVGAIFWSAMFVQNDGWMAVGECGVSDI